MNWYKTESKSLILINEQISCKFVIFYDENIIKKYDIKISNLELFDELKCPILTHNIIKD